MCVRSQFGSATVWLKHLSGNDNWSMPRMGLHVWPGARLLCEEMGRHRSTYVQHMKSVLVLGAGTGLEGLVFAALAAADGASNEAYDERIVCLTDGAVLSCDLMLENIDLNPQPGLVRFEVRRLRFAEAKDHQELPIAAPWDLVAISDSTFDFDLVPSVLQTIEWLKPKVLAIASVTGGAPAFEREIARSSRILSASNSLLSRFYLASISLLTSQYRTLVFLSHQRAQRGAAPAWSAAG